ncbi:hypothetical protein DFH09DRAFT_1110398 [Mycena vulgaris]|nr:hypothetical protein DFH09DRAFT_1110398 [Mycena vulgaris]
MLPSTLKYIILTLVLTALSGSACQQRDEPCSLSVSTSCCKGLTCKGIAVRNPVGGVDAAYIFRPGGPAVASKIRPEESMEQQCMSGVGLDIDMEKADVIDKPPIWAR